MTSMSSFDRTGLALTLYPPVDVDGYRTAAARLPVSRGNTLPRTPAHADLTIRSRGVCSILHSGYAPNLLRSRYSRIKYQGPSMQSAPIRPYNLTGVAIMNTLNTAVSRVAESL